MATVSRTRKTKDGTHTITKIVHEQKAAQEFYGEIVYWEIPASHSYTSIKQALEYATLDVSKLKQTTAATAFARVAHQLSEDGFFDKLDKQGKEIVFQLTDKAIVENNGDKEIEFFRKAFLRLDTETGTVTCPTLPTLATKIETLIREHQSRRLPSEIGTLIKSLFDDKCDVFPIRGRDSGVYFVPETSKEYLNKISEFLNCLSGYLHRIPMVKDSGTRQSAASAIENGIKNMIADQNDAIAALDTNSRADTLQKQYEKITAIEMKMAAYSYLLKDKVEEIQKTIKESRDKVAAKILEVQTFKQQSTLCSVKVASNRCIIWGYSLCKMSRFLRYKKGWEFEKIVRLAKNLFGQRVTGPSLVCMASVNKGYDDVSITDEQFQQLDDIAASSADTPHCETIEGGLITIETSDE